MRSPTPERLLGLRGPGWVVSRRAEKSFDECRVAGPCFEDHVARYLPARIAEGESDHNTVVERANYWKELRDEIDR